MSRIFLEPAFCNIIVRLFGFVFDESLYETIEMLFLVVTCEYVGFLVFVLGMV